jgi:hypothetical protein
MCVVTDANKKVTGGKCKGRRKQIWRPGVTTGTGLQTSDRSRKCVACLGKERVK